MNEGRVVGTEDYHGNDRVQSVNDEPSETVQSDAHLADINRIMADFGEGGIEALNEADLMFKDVSEFTDLRDALDQAKLAEVEFLKLPSKVREIFDHDVAVWLDTAHDKEKRDALVQAGFLKAEKVGEKAAGAAAAPDAKAAGAAGSGAEGGPSGGSE